MVSEGCREQVFPTAGWACASEFVLLAPQCLLWFCGMPACSCRVSEVPCMAGSRRLRLTRAAVPTEWVVLPGQVPPWQGLLLTGAWLTLRHPQQASHHEQGSFLDGPYLRTISNRVDSTG